MSRGIITISEMGAVTMPTTPVWMMQFEIADLLGVFSCNVRKTIRAIYKNNELNAIRKELSAMEPLKCDAYIRKALSLLAKKSGV